MKKDQLRLGSNPVSFGSIFETFLDQVTMQSTLLPPQTVILSVLSPYNGTIVKTTQKENK
jgi:hypothetical protein